MLMLVLALAVAPQPVASTEADLHCMVAIASAVESASAEQKPGLIAGIWYFFGKIDAVAPTMDLQAEMGRVAASEDATALREDLTRCGKILEQRGNYMSVVGKALEQAPVTK